MGCCETREVVKENKHSGSRDLKIKQTFSRNNTTMLSELVFYYNKYLQDRAEEIVDIVLIDRGLSDKNLELLATLLSKLMNLKGLVLVNNSLNTNGISIISSHLGLLTDLKTLNISYNNIRRAGLEILLENLKPLKSLTYLNLASNDITDNELPLLQHITSTAFPTTLSHFDLRDNPMTFTAFSLLLNHSLENPALKVLLLYNENLTQDHLNQLKALAKGLVIDE